MSDDLFAAAASERLSHRAPLADRLRPVRLDDIVGQAATVRESGNVTSDDAVAVGLGGRCNCHVEPQHFRRLERNIGTAC